MKHCVKTLVCLFILLSILSSCSNGVSRVQLSPQNKNITELAATKYSSSKLKEIALYDGTMEEFNTKYPIECVRADGKAYRVSYLGENQLCVIAFDQKGNKITGKVCNQVLSTSNFNSLSVGQSLENVLHVDPDGEYLFLESGRNDLPRISKHYTKDGYLITVMYDNENIILEIIKELI